MIGVPIFYMCDKPRFVLNIFGCIMHVCVCVFVCCRYSGVLSAYGLALADVVEEVQEPCSLKYEQKSFHELDRRVEHLSKRCHDTLCARGFTRSAPPHSTTWFGVNGMPLQVC